MNDRGKTCKFTVDGTDCPIWADFNKMWYSHKFKGPGLRYEVAVCIQTGWIVWINGPYPAGRWPDISIFRHRLRQKLVNGEMVEADLGYRGKYAYVRVADSAVSLSDHRAARKARLRHEHINSRLKTFCCLSKKFRHPLHKHAFFFRAATVCVQVSMMMGERPWQVRY